MIFWSIPFGCCASSYLNGVCGGVRGETPKGCGSFFYGRLRKLHSLHTICLCINLVRTLKNAQYKLHFRLFIENKIIFIIFWWSFRYWHFDGKCVFAYSRRRRRTTKQYEGAAPQNRFPSRTKSNLGELFYGVLKSAQNKMTHKEMGNWKFCEILSEMFFFERYDDHTRKFHCINIFLFSSTSSSSRRRCMEQRYS